MKLNEALEQVKPLNQAAADKAQASMDQQGDHKNKYDLTCSRESEPGTGFQAEFIAHGGLRRPGLMREQGITKINMA